MQEVTAWVVATLASLGGLAAAVWAWLEKQRKHRQDETGLPYKVLFAGIQKELQLVQKGFAQIKEEHSQCQIRLARMENEIDHLHRENERQQQEIADLRKAKTGGQS